MKRRRINRIFTLLLHLMDCCCRVKLCFANLFKEASRLKTFDKWKVTCVDKGELARLGFYYFGTGDFVKCYFCELVLGVWEAHDNPLEEHLKHSPRCDLLMRNKTKNIPIDPQKLEESLPALDEYGCFFSITFPSPAETDTETSSERGKLWKTFFNVFKRKKV